MAEWEDILLGGVSGVVGKKGFGMMARLISFLLVSGARVGDKGGGHRRMVS